MRANAVFVSAVAALVLVSGCSRNLRKGSSAAEVRRATVDVGVIDENFVAEHSLKDFAGRRIKSVKRGCGCQGVSVKEGEHITHDSVIRMSVDVGKRPPGEDTLTARVAYDSGPDLLFAVKYFYVPRPSYEPERFIFRPGSSEQTLRLEFPGEADVKVDLDHASPLSVSDAEHRVEVDKITTTVVEVPVAALSQEIEWPLSGNIVVKTSSKRMARCRIPFVVLRN